MCWSARLLVLFPLLCASLMTPALAQEQSGEMESLPTELSPEQLLGLQQWSVAPIPQEPQTRVRRRLPVPVFPLTPEELSYREAVRKLGVNKNHFVHVDLSNGKVRTGVITEIHDEGFLLKDGLIDIQWVPYTDLKAAPRAVAAVGTRLVHGLKMTGIVTAFVVVVPVAIALSVPLVILGVIVD
jgi:hypothetical protein